MLIRSQNKDVIINLENLISVRIGGYSGDSIVVFTECEALEIGKYSNTEKAIKVLDMICAFANEKHYEAVVPEQCGSIDGIVFQMPQDSEV